MENCQANHTPFYGPKSQLIFMTLSMKLTPIKSTISPYSTYLPAKITGMVGWTVLGCFVNTRLGGSTFMKTQSVDFNTAMIFTLCIFNIPLVFAG